MVMVAIENSIYLKPEEEFHECKQFVILHPKLLHFPLTTLVECFLFFTKAVEYDYKSYDFIDYDVVLSMKDYLKPDFDKWTSSCQLG